MKKFTKDITALLATVTLSASLGATGSAYAAADEPVRTAGEAINPAVTTTGPAQTTCMVGTEMPTTTTTTSTTTTTIGTETTRLSSPTTTTTTTTTTTVGTETTRIETTTMPPLQGTYVTTTTTELTATIGTETTRFETTTMPPLIGTEVITTTTSTETIELPPLMGDIMPADGDANGDGSFNAADIVAVSNFLTNVPDKPETDGSEGGNRFKLENWHASDLNHDGRINALDLTLMLRRLLGVY